LMIIEFRGKRPQIAPSAYIAPNATIIGDVVIEAEASVWFGAVLRGDHGRIVIGARSSVQDNVVIHVNGRHNTIIEADVTIGHGAVLEGCHVHAGSLVGMNATVLSGAIVEAGALVAAGAVVGENQRIPAGRLAVGIPARARSVLSEATQQRLIEASQKYVAYGRSYQTDAKIIDDFE
jgi:carbonic anhydrase/acetyltransferase-like protein (isoleucine patch superfamily)